MDRRLLTIERLLVCDIVHQQDTHRSSVVCGGDCPEALLPCRVPYLELHSLPIQVDGPDLEVDSYCGDERWREAVLTESQ
jgi:hypothetical protein